MQGGAQDEFFPLPQLLKTFDRLRAPAKSLAVMPDYDHQWYFGSGCTAALHARRAARREAPRRLPGRLPARLPRRPALAVLRPARQLQPQRGGDRPLGPAAAGAGLAARRPPAPRVRPAAPRPHRHAQGRCDRRARRRHRAARRPSGRSATTAASPGGSSPCCPTPGAATGASTPGWPAGALLFAEIEAADGTVATSAPQLPRGFRPVIRPFEALAKPLAKK